MTAATAPSAARIAANRLNAAKSTGPRTAEGKARSRANAVKHGLTGAGVALPAEVRDQVEARFLTFQEDMGPSNMLGMVLVREMALMSVRVERAARHEAATVASAMGRAAVEFDLARLAEVDRLFEGLAASPGANRRRLLTMPEGVDRLIEALEAVREQIEGGQARFWGADERAEIEGFFGRKRVFFPISRTSALLEALGGDFRWVGVNDPVHQLSPVARQGWARSGLIHAVDEELARLAKIRASCDHAELARDRLGAADRALFDPGAEAAHARKYEAGAARRFNRALRDFQQNEANFLGVDGTLEPINPVSFESHDMPDPGAVGEIRENEPNAETPDVQTREPEEVAAIAPADASPEPAAPSPSGSSRPDEPRAPGPRPSWWPAHFDSPRPVSLVPHFWAGSTSEASDA